MSVIRTIKRNLMVLLLLAFLPGCAAPVGVGLMAAGAGFDIFKLHQFTTGGEMKVTFADTQIKKPALRQVKKIAVYSPDSYWGNKETSALVDRLEKQDYEVVSPYRVKKVSGLHRGDLKTMTSNERLEFFSEVCQKTSTEAILYLSYKGTGTDVNFVQRSAMKTPFSIKVFSSDAKILWDQEGEVVVESGDRLPPNEEVGEKFASAIMKKMEAV